MSSSRLPTQTNDDERTNEASPDQQDAPAATEMDEEIRRSLPVAFVIDNAERANWLVRRVLEARAYRDRITQWAEAERRRGEREEERLMYLFGQQLRLWVTTELDRLGGRRKSLGLPAGTVGYRHMGPSLVIENLDGVLKWAKEHCPSAVTISERLGKSILSDHVLATGEVPDEGLRIEPEREMFFIR